MSAKAQAEKDKGNEAFKAGDFPKAIGHYTAAFIADPSNPTYPLNRAAAYLKLGKNEDAERDCDAVLRLDPKNVKGLFRRGQARVAMQKLHEAEADFAQALKLDPANQAAKQELQKVKAALQAIPAKPKQRIPVEVSLPAPSSSASSTPSPPKRRRIPIQIVESAQTAGPSSQPSASKAAKDDLLTPVASRPLAESSPAQRSSDTTASDSSEPAPAAPSASRPPPSTYREAKAAREEARPRGGIFRADGTQKLFTSAPTSQNGSTSAPKREPPQTLVAFMNIWKTLRTEEERWDVLRQIPPTRLPVLFKTSLDPPVLAAILHTLRVALGAAPEDEERLRVVRGYMVNLPRVPRFNTVSLMMSAAERADAQVVWDLLGRYQGEGVEGEMEKRKETISPPRLSPVSESGTARPGQTTTPVPRPPTPQNPFSSPTNPFAPSAPPPLVPPRPTVPALQPTPPPGPAQTSGPAPDLQPQLATAIEAFACTLPQTITPQQSAGGERHNVREPDQFDGSDPNKLRLFFAQLELVFKARPRTFDSEEKKVTYAISFLKGTALQWFEPYLLEGASDNPPLFMYSYEAFQDELRVNFGPYDASGAAEHELMNLQMGENQRIAKYITQFTRLATEVRWGNAPLRYRFYNGLPNRLKDRISESIDNRYWERKAEQSWESGGSKSGHKSSSDSKSGSSNKSGNTSATQTNSGSTPSKSTNSGSTPKTPAKTPAKPYSDKLGKDGKLTPEEQIFLVSKARAAQATPAAPTPAAAPAKTKETKN
ncbi:hypothetical protein ACG7TL_006121 [Trametes sanguinea]